MRPYTLTNTNLSKPIRKKLHISNQTGHHTPLAHLMLATTIHKSNTTPHHQRRGDNTPSPPASGETTGLLPQSPIVCPVIFPRRLDLSIPDRPGRLLCTQPAATTAHGFLTAHTPTTGVSLVVLLRKEVIQPHLPVRLPCYDFVPIADPTFDGSLHKG